MCFPSCWYVYMFELFIYKSLKLVVSKMVYVCALLLGRSAKAPKGIVDEISIEPYDSHLSLRTRWLFHSFWEKIWPLFKDPLNEDDQLNIWYFFKDYAFKLDEKKRKWPLYKPISLSWLKIIINTIVGFVYSQGSRNWFNFFESQFGSWWTRAKTVLEFPANYTKFFFFPFA